MDHRSDWASSAGAGSATVVAPYRKRRHYRQKIHSLAYVNLDQANGGIIRDLSEAGIAIQAVAPLCVNQQVYLRFELLGPRIRVEAAGRVAWADAMGQAGVEFMSVSQRFRRLLKEWLFTQILTAAHQAAWDSIFLHSKGGGVATELLFSACPRPVIHLEPEPTTPQGFIEKELEEQPAALALLGFPIPLSLRALSRLVDSLVLLSSVLLFSVISLAMTHVLPTWPVVLAVEVGATCMFAALYWFLFVVWIGITPGTHLARLAGSESNGMYPGEEDRPRFR